MTAAKTKCVKCDAEILSVTFERTGGLCMPCKKGAPKRPDSKEPVSVSCEVSSKYSGRTVIHTSAQVLLAELEETRHIGDSMHPNKFELEAQRALLRHFIRVHHDFRLHVDHWGRTGWALLKLFEQGRATLECEQARYQFSDLTKTEWQEGDHPLGMQGGFSYLDENGTIVFKTMTWIS